MIVSRRGAAALSLAVASVAACGSSSERAPGHAGTATGKALLAAVEAAAELRAPWRCAAAGGSGPGGAVPAATIGVGDQAWRRDGQALRATRPRTPLVIAAVAQARGAPMADRLRAALAAERPDLVLALGGMGADPAELERALAALAVPGALVVALPGDGESWPALTAAVAHLAAGGIAIVDGAAVRTVDAGGAVLATLPGLAHAGQLGAGADGCLHDDDDVAAALAALAAIAGDRPRLLAGPRAPQGDSTASGEHDLVADIHVGDPDLTAALADAGLTLMVHGVVDAPPTAGASPARAGATVAAGSLDPGPRWDVDGRPLAPTITVAVVDDHGVRWRAVGELTK